MKNDIVIVFDDPVEWAIFARMNGEEPDISGRASVAPFFKKRPNANSHFDENERQALGILNVPSDTLVIKREALSQTGEWHVVYTTLSETIFEEEMLRLGDACCFFLKNLGVKNLGISIVDEIAEKCIKMGQAVPKKTIRRLTDDNSRNSFLNKAQARFSFLGTFKKCDADYNFCSSCLNGNEVLSSKFGSLLEQLKENRLQGHFSSMARFELPSEFLEKCHSAIAIARNYSLIDAETKCRLEEEERRWAHRSLTFKYSFDLQ